MTTVPNRLTAGPEPLCHCRVFHLRSLGERLLVSTTPGRACSSIFVGKQRMRNSSRRAWPGSLLLTYLRNLSRNWLVIETKLNRAKEGGEKMCEEPRPPGIEQNPIGSLECTLLLVLSMPRIAPS